MTAADGVAVDHRDDGLGHDADQALQIKHVQSRDVVLPHVAAVAALTSGRRPEAERAPGPRGARRGLRPSG